ncbi:ABC transporter substrate-binding protein [Actinoplanes sp. NPDC049265]|uniref:ABC transporter substrate-binding protein n=1 Tax=Actinoplanes sp. NPDC049265 TaxID=3363902 RepID=UPI0037221B3F
MRITRLHRTAGLLLAAALAGLSAAACGGGGGDATGTGPLSLYSDNPTWEKGFTEAGTALQKITGRGIKPVSVPSTSDYEQVVRTSISTKKTNDLVKWWSGYKLQDLASTGLLTDLTDVWNTAEKNGWVDPALKPNYTFQGKVYGLPMYQSYWVVFYSKTLFAKYHIEPPATFADFEKAAATLKKNGVTPLWTGQSDTWTSFVVYQALVAAQSPDYYGKLTRNQAAWTDPVSQNTLDIWKGWIAKGWTTPADSKLADAPAMMKSGKVAMLPAGTWENSNLKLAGLTPDADYGAFFMPTVTPGAPKATFVEGGAWTVPKNAPDRADAVKQLGSWLDPSVQRVWSDFLADSSANPKVPSGDPLIKKVQAQVAQDKPVLLNRFYEAFPSKLVLAATTELDGFMVHPDTGPKVLDSIQKTSVTEWDAWKKQAG